MDRPSKRHCPEPTGMVPEASWEEKAQEAVRYHDLQPPLPPVQYISAQHYSHHGAGQLGGHAHVPPPYASYHSYAPYMNYL